VESSGEVKSFFTFHIF